MLFLGAWFSACFFRVPFTKEKKIFSFSSVYEISQISSFTNGKNNGNPIACNLVDLQHSRLEIIAIPMVKQ